jgi:multicomponent K+:H+ antiporter subunit E
MSDSRITTVDGSSFRQRWLPHPLLTATLAAFWILLLNGFSMGGLVLGLAMGILIPLYTTNFWPNPPRVKSWPAAASYFFLVLWDIIVANVQVAYWILFRRADQLQSTFFTVPLDIRVPEGIATLAGTITMTPGTVSADLSADGRALLVHGLHVPHPEDAVATIKSRYEARLLEIFA